ncbi:MAG: hypothetical protein HYZ57_13775 [Acidobacteria bacterium]|nr:hypothetical protein [Acidobacteriota bacterium]
MRGSLLRGIIAGVIAGLVFGAMMQMMMAPAPTGGEMPMMAMVAKVVGSDSILVGWVYHLFNSAVIGALFGLIFGARVRGYPSVFGWGAAYGVFWWVLGALILMPILLGMPAFAPLMMGPMRIVAMGSLVGHIIYGLVLGGVFLMLHHRPAALRTT